MIYPVTLNVLSSLLDKIIPTDIKHNAKITFNMVKFLVS